MAEPRLEPAADGATVVVVDRVASTLHIVQQALLLGPQLLNALLQPPRALVEPLLEMPLLLLQPHLSRTPPGRLPGVACTAWRQLQAPELHCDTGCRVTISVRREDTGRGNSLQIGTHQFRMPTCVPFLTHVIIRPNNTNNPIPETYTPTTSTKQRSNRKKTKTQTKKDQIKMGTRETGHRLQRRHELHTALPPDAAHLRWPRRPRWACTRSRT